MEVRGLEEAMALRAAGPAEQQLGLLGEAMLLMLGVCHQTTSGGEGGAFGDDRDGGDHGRGGDHEAESGGVAPEPKAKAGPKAKTKVVAARGSRDEPWGPVGLAKAGSGGNHRLGVPVSPAQKQR